jgi:spermidine dehydrogenase
MKNSSELSPEEKKYLGLDRLINRRDFLQCLLITAGGLILPGRINSGNNPAGVGKSASKKPDNWYYGENTEKTIITCHGVSSGDLFNRGVKDTGEIYDLVIVGGGLEGLTAAYFYHEEIPEGKILVIDYHANFGRDSQHNELTVKGEKIIVSSGGDFQWKIDPEYIEVKKLWSDLGIDLPGTSPINFMPEAYQDQIFINGKWVKDFWETGYKSASSPWPKRIQDDYNAFWEILESFKWEPWPKVKKQLAELDKLTLKEWMEDVNGWDPQLTHLMDMWIRSDSGAGADTLSAACGFWNYAGGSTEYYQWPGGRSGFARHLIHALIPGAFSSKDIITADLNYNVFDRPENIINVRLKSTVVNVKHDGPAEEADHVNIMYLMNNKLYRVKARYVIMANGGYMTKNIVSDLPQDHKYAYGKFYYTSYMVANVWIKNSRALDNLNFGYSGGISDPLIATYLTIADGIPEKGYDPNRDPDRPNCITMWCPQLPDPSINGDYEKQGRRARAELLNRNFEDYEILIRQELLNVFGGAGFNPAKDIVGIAINRWGHAEVFRYPGFAFASGSSDEPVPGVPIYDAGRRFGRIAFAHTDLNGFADNQGTTRISRRAVDELLS